MHEESQEIIYDMSENAQTTVAGRIVEVLTERIVTGELPPGTPLRQDHIAAEFKASHVPAREALQLLRAAGLAVSEPRRGMRVAPLDSRAVREIVEIRAALEVVALRHAAPRLNAAQMTKIELALIEGERATSLKEWDAANRAFHRELVAFCAMPRLLVMLDELRMANSRAVFALPRSASWQPRSNQDHRKILEALRNRELDSAARLLDRHIRGIENTRGDVFG